MTPVCTSGQRATVLWLTYGLPLPADCGAAVRYFELLRQVSGRYRVILCSITESPPRPEDVAALSSWCKRVEWVRMPCGPRRWLDLPHHLRRRHPLATWPYYSRAMETRVEQVLREESVDIVQVEHSFLAPYIQALPRGSFRTVLSMHNFAEAQYATMTNMQMGLLARLAWLGKARCMRGWEAQLGAQYDRCLAVSPRERTQLAAAMGRPVALVPNGVNTASFQLLPQRSGNRLLFVGNLRYPPNQDAVRFLVREILPWVLREIPSARLVVVGDRPPGTLADCEGGAVEFVGRVHDLIPYYLDAQVVLAPLRAGGGTRLKILEAMALGRPVVATPMGCEGLAVTPQEHLLVAEQPQALADGVTSLLRDPLLRERLSQAARQLVEREYDWKHIGHRLLAVYDELLSGAPSG